MSSWRCLQCRTTYAVGLQACPHCGDTGYSEGGVVAHASAVGGSTHYVGENDPVPTDLPPEVRLVGPGAPQDPAAAAEPDTGDVAVEPEDSGAAEAVSEPPELPDPPTPPDSSPSSSDPADGDDEDGPVSWDDYPIRVLRDICRELGLSPTGAKADLVDRLNAHDAEHAEQ